MAALLCVRRGRNSVRIILPDAKQASKGDRSMNHVLRMVAWMAALALLASTSTSWAQAKKGEDHHHEHGPHDGVLVELGDEEYHGEIVDDQKTGKVTVYLLDSKAKEAVAIEAKEVQINVRKGGKPEQFRLKAKPQDKDAKGKSSRFELDSRNLIKLLDDEKAECRLRVVIKGRLFNAKIAHHHHHEESKKSS